jgi:hypothetical protein
MFKKHKTIKNCTKQPDNIYSKITATSQGDLL